MKRLNLALLITILSILFAGISSILSNAISLPPPVKGIALPLLGLCLAFMVLFAVMQQVQGQKSLPSLFSFEILQVSHVNIRGKLLQKIKRDWIDEYLESVLFTKQVLSVEASYQPNAVENSNRLDSISSLPIFSLSLQNLYDLSHDGLLILGSSGAGKTIALIELARTLLYHAENDDKQPIPVILSLSSWDMKRAPLHEWMAQELQIRYGVSQQLAQYWIETDQLLPLLDDFDMVADTWRAACIQAINTYRQLHGLTPLVVCSRSEEYLAQPVRLHLRHAVVLQPLSSALVATYITQESQKLKPIRTILKRYPRLLTYVRFPRFLDLLARYIAKHATSAQEYRSLLRSENFHLVEQKLLNSYIQRQLQQIPPSTHVTPLQICQTLHWLALSMKAHHQTLFALEELQPDWLPDEHLRQTAQLRMRWLIIIAYTIVGELNGILLSQSGKLPFMTISFILSQIACYRFLRLVKDVTIVQKPYLDVSLIEMISWAWKHERSRLIKFAFRIVCICILIVGGCVTLLGIPVGLWKGWTFGLLSGFLIGIFAVICIFAGGIVGALRIGLVRHHPRRPQDGIWRSARHGMLYGLLLGGGVGSIVFIITQSLQFGLKSSQWFAMALGISCGLNIWLFCSLINGGYALLQQYVILSLLKKAGVTPKELPVLLNVAVQCRLLCFINSSFMFPHRWLLNYFASHFRKEESHTSY